jgi:3-deoxy-D-manno-octulosonic-acid transferase
MNPALRVAYSAVGQFARAAAALAPAGGSKWRRSLAARRGIRARYAAWARQRDRGRPLLWLHAPSVGEGLQAEPVLRRLRALHPGWQFAWTFFSPSAEGLAERVGADVADFLPYDARAEVGALLDALRPDALVFSKLDLWPELATRAVVHGATVALVAATVSPGSGRLRWPARGLLRAGYQSVAAAGAIADADAGRLARLGVPRDRIRVTGDPRFDSVAARVRSVPPDDPLLRLGRGAPTLVAGSTWPADEAVLLAAFAGVRASHPAARLILVPHEPTPDHLLLVEREAARADLPSPVRLSAASGPAPLVLVDRVGVLAALYGAGTMAYVGGGFGRAGLHSVLEPAAWGIPVAFGPRWKESRDAGLVLEAGAAAALPDVRSVEGLRRCWLDWIEDEAGREEQGRRARAVVERGLGAARRSAELLAELIGSRPPRTSPTGGPPAPR